MGGTVGALLVHTPASMAGTELEATRAGGPPRHVAIIARRITERVTHTAVFPALPEGHYQLHCKPDGPVRLHATVIGGRVTETRWPDAGAEAARRRQADTGLRGQPHLQNASVHRKGPPVPRRPSAAGAVRHP
jgi:hypothetical protein